MLITAVKSLLVGKNTIVVKEHNMKFIWTALEKKTPRGM